MSSPIDDRELSQEELDMMDENLTQIEMIYKSRCVSMPGKNNVTIREIPSKNEEEK